MAVNLSLRPIHYACVSGGKDSLYMLNLILHNQDTYPLDMVVNFELEIDWPFAKNVVDYIEKECNNYGIKFVRIKPRKSIAQLKAERRGTLYSRGCKWCNYNYKLDCEKQLRKWIKEQNCRPVAYIGLCADEDKRFKYTIGNWKEQDICYPLAEEGIIEPVILDWAKNIDIFEGWYKLFRRQGCMFCPNSTKLELAYLKKNYPDKYQYWINEIKEFEKICEDRNYKHKYYYSNIPIDLVDKQIDEIYIHQLEPAKHKKLF